MSRSWLDEEHKEFCINFVSLPRMRSGYMSMSVILNYLTIVGVAKCNIAPRPDLTHSTQILLVMNSIQSVDLRNLNTKRIDEAYVRIHRELRRQMFEQAGSSAYGSPQHLTMADYIIYFTCNHDITPIVHGPDIELPEQPLIEDVEL